MENDIAIIGIACRFPGAQNYDEFWDNLKEGRSSIQEIPKERWDWEAYWGDPGSGKNKSNSKWGGFIQDVDAFDPGFFGLSAREVEATDPQQRIMLELSWSCFEDAGIRPSHVSGDKIGVYMGVFNFDYKGLLERKDQTIETYHSIGTASGVIANRISHYFNLKGPSFPIDTACSSSFNAIHSAAQSLQLGECSMALAGGISLILTPSRHISFSKAGMLSPTGSCKTFDDSADGYVRSEGAGMVLLKPLQQALDDGDSIYGVLKGSAINHNGKTHTLTYPNPDAQAEVITEAHKKAGIPVESISYIEAHGTGTPKGDPMEIQGLLKAFELLNPEKEANLNKNYCGLGSVKTNIGHLESAAGIAGIIKVLMSMKHKQLPGLQNFKKLNHRISIDDSPFYMVDKLQEWKPLEGKGKQAFPRRAGISSFGFGGTNAHVVLEEAPSKKKASSKKLPYYLISLSAKTEEALRQRQQDLALWLDTKGSGHALTEISATLLLRREHFGIRAAFVVKDVRELKERLNQVLEGEEPDGYFKERIPLKGLKEQPLFEQLSKVLVNELQLIKKSSVQEYGSKLKALAELYVKGYEVDWREIFPGEPLEHIHLPTYPFARERYWIAEEDIQEDITAIDHADAVIHPLVHHNTSDFSEQRFSSTFTGREYFLADHVVEGRRVLPGVAYLEMARKAIDKSAGYLKEEKSAISLKNVVWAKPIAVGEQVKQVHIGLFPEENGEISFEIYSKEEGNDAESVVHSQGNASLSPVGDNPKLNMDELMGQFTKSNYPLKQYYEAFRSMGIDYGPAHQGIEEVYLGANKVLTKLSLPVSVQSTGERFVLHPSLMDSALQAAMILMRGSEFENSSGSTGSFKLFVPFALQELEIWKNCTSTMWAQVHYSNGSAGGKSAKVDIDLLDEQGTLCVRMKGLSWRELASAPALYKPRMDSETILLHPCWKEQEIVGQASLPVYDEHLVVLCDMSEPIRKKIETHLEDARILSLKHKQKNIEKRYEAYTVKLFEEIQDIMKDGSKRNVFIQIVTSLHQEGHLLFTGLSGLIKTAILENPKFTGQMIQLEPERDPAGFVEQLKENSKYPQDFHVRYVDGKRQVIGWNKIENQTALIDMSFPWKDGGAYLITGGTGGLGLLFAKEIASHTKEVSLILTGRSPLHTDKQILLDEIRSLGARVEYKQVDVTNKQQTEGLVQSIVDEFGSFNGIIHSAGVIKDSFILHKTAEELQEVLAPKVTGLMNLERASKDAQLDFFVVFSSVFGIMGNPGQADYCSANAFMDAFATYRNSLVKSDQRSGRTLSMNWPLWKDGGMHVDEETEMMMLQKLGMSAVESNTGIRAFYQALASAWDQVVFMEGDPDLFYSRLCGEQDIQKLEQPPLPAAENKPSLEGAEDAFKEQAADYMKKLISTVLKLPVQRIEADAPMENYGIDSIMTTQLTNELEKTFGSLSKTLFFEYQNIRELTGYFLTSYRDRLVELLGEGAGAKPTARKLEGSVSESEAEMPSITTRRRSRFASIGLGGQNEKTAALDVAIIGISGRYPGADNVEEFWDVLKNGQDCITEIPEERWDYQLYFDEDKNKPGKTYSKWGGFIDDVDKFDPLFFNISPREAEMMDPQERLFLQCVYETMEDAGYTRETLGLYNKAGLEGNVGVYVGAMYQEYQLYGAQEQILGNPLTLPGLPASIANRVSYFCNFHGPSLTVDTMCSSSLTAIHLACQSMQRGECELSIAGGVNVSIHPNKYLYLSQGKFISGKGRCESFGEGGDGYVPGEGVGAVLLKPLHKAIADGDHIYGIIKATSINHGGKTNGYTVPNPNAQASVIGRAFKEAGIDPRTISYLEAHGTGTSLGDPIEIAGLNHIFQDYTSDKQFCAIGSAKSNIGHCESAAGIAGLTKVLLQLKYKQIAPSLHSKVLNPNIDFANTPFVVQQELAEWKRPFLEKNGVLREYPRIAGISSFGAGGSNAHIVIEEYIPEELQFPQVTINTLNPFIIVLSAKTAEQLKEQAHRLLKDIGEQHYDDSYLSDMAYTLQTGREAMDERLALIVATIKELKEKLDDFIEGRDQVDGLYYGQVKRNKDALSVFIRDEELQEAIFKWIQRKKYSKLMNLWVKGLSVDWSKLYEDFKPHRISLPVYPFSRDRYWAPDVNHLVRDNCEEAKREDIFPVRQKPPVQRKLCFLNKQWKPKQPATVKFITRTVAILTTQETRDIAVQVSKHFANSHILDAQDMAGELQQTDHDWRNYGGCIDLIGCGRNRSELKEWIPWLQKWIGHGNKEGLRLLSVTKGLESFHNKEINLSGADRAALYRMLQSEYSHLNSHHMDVEASSDDHTIAEQIASEFAADSKDSEVCYRSGIRYRALLEELPEKAAGKEPFVFPEGHVLWITGGTRGLGYLCARHFVSKYGVRKLVLTGREELPPREQWEHYKQQATSTGQKIRNIQALEEQDVEVKILSVSLTNEQGLQQSVQVAQSTIGPIGGVIHCAGLVDIQNPAFIRKAVEGIEEVSEPKIPGLHKLFQSFEKDPLKFFILFSSVSSTVPALAAGQSDYSMANAYMDYFAEAEKDACQVVSIQWPSWKETGMGEVRSRAYERTGLLSMTNEEGLQLLDQILSSKMGPVVLPAVVNPEIWEPDQLMQHAVQENLQTDIRKHRKTDTELSSNTEKQLNTIQTWLVDLLAQELKIESSRLEIDTTFQDYGVDSIMLAQLLRRINQLAEVDLEPTVLFEYPSIESLATWFVKTHPAAVSKVLKVSLIEASGVGFTELVPPVHAASIKSRTMEKGQRTDSTDIAVIGLSCRFPGANSLEEYWKMLSEGRSAIRSVPYERWGYHNHYYAGLLDDISSYDPSFFLIPEADAMAMDPQALLVLEESFKLLCHAGYSQNEVKGKPVGVYLGARTQHQPEASSLYKARNPIVAVGQNYLAANISQFLDLRGPSVVVDTACSSALVGMNMAVQALYAGDIESAIVGGVSLLTTDSAHKIFEQREILSSTQDFHMFDKRAGGIIPGEGAGMVLLKTVEQAIADGDRVYAVIKGIAVNNDGRTAGPAAPNIQAQKEVLQSALRKSGRQPEEISYVETNGSGTKVTDLLELKVIQSIYRASNSVAPLGLGSMKPNIGHPLCAEGIASFIKVVLMMQYGRFVPFLSGEEPMTHYDMTNTPFSFSRNNNEWSNSTRTAAINCFADGGTNAHVVLEDGAELASRRNVRQPLPLPALNKKQIWQGKSRSVSSVSSVSSEVLQLNFWERFD